MVDPTEFIIDHLWRHAWHFDSLPRLAAEHRDLRRDHREFRKASKIRSVEGVDARNVVGQHRRGELQIKNIRTRHGPPPEQVQPAVDGAGWDRQYLQECEEAGNSLHSVCR